MDRFSSAMPTLLSNAIDAQRNLTAVSKTMRPDDSVQAIASTIASAIVASAQLADYIATTHHANDLLAATCLAFDRLRSVAMNDDHSGLFDAIAMPRFDSWPPAAQNYSFIDGESVYVLHDEHGAIFGHPELRDEHTFLWYWDPRMAAAHLAVLHAARPKLHNEH